MREPSGEAVFGPAGYIMNIGILSVRDNAYHPNRRLIETGSRLGHKISLIHTRECLSETGARGVDLQILNDPDFRPDLILPRIGATINDYAMAIVRQFELSGIPVVNGYYAILPARNKFLCLQTLSLHNLPVPETYLVINLKGFNAVAEKLGGYPVVVKSLQSRQGAGVALVQSSHMAEFVLNNLQDISQGLLVQEFIPTRSRRDIRAFVIGDRVVSAMELKPNAGDFRSNIHLAGNGKSFNPDLELSDLAVRSSKALGLEISGVDIILDERGKAKVIEVNYSPGFRGIEAATGMDIASRIVEYLTNRSMEGICT